MSESFNILEDYSNYLNETGKYNSSAYKGLTENKIDQNELVGIDKDPDAENLKLTAQDCLDNKIIDYFVDTTPDKSNKFMPGKNIKIKRYEKTLLDNVDYIYLGAWNFKNEIFKKERQFIKKNGKFITHVPKPMII